MNMNVSTGVTHTGRCPNCHQWMWGASHVCGLGIAPSTTAATVTTIYPTSSYLTTGQIAAPNFEQASPGEPIVRMLG